MNRKMTMSRFAMAAVALACGPVLAEQTSNLVTVSISGSTAMRSFTTSTAFRTIESGRTLNLSNGTYNGGPLTFGPGAAPAGNPAPNLSNSTGPGARIEWHEAGSIEGMLELANDQIGYIGSQIVDPFTIRDPSALNNIRVNGNVFTGPGTQGGYGLSSSTYNTYTNYNAAGTNLQGGQNRVQWAISDVPAVQGFSVAGTGTFNLRPGDAGYGKGNALLPSTSGSNANIGKANGRQQLADRNVLMMSTNKVDPATGANYSAGAWNTATTDNLVSKTVAVTATSIAANPGTGLTSINKTDAQFLQTAGRLANGVDFNVATRDVNSGTRNTAALNTGVDPSWASGENDAGNGYNLAAGTGLNDPTLGNANAQATIGAQLKFSGKTAGGQLRPTVQNNRMAVGTLGLADTKAFADAGAVTASNNPLRGLKFSDTTYAANGTDASFNPVLISAASITDGSYKIWQQQQYVFVKRPDVVGYATDSVYKGDTTGATGQTLATGAATGNVAAVSNNIFNSVVSFPNNSSIATPADGLLTNSFVLPQFMIVAKPTDGAAVTAVPANAGIRGQFLADASSNNFNLASPALIKNGNGARYGVNGAQTTPNYGLNGTNQQIPITATNYLFGNFNQNGVRDFAAVKTAVAAQQTIAASPAMQDGGSITNQTVVFNGLTKGDLIVMGDYNGDGRFDGKDLGAMARGAAIADSTSVDSVTITGAGAVGSEAFNEAFSAKLRTSVLRKNAALDYLQLNATAQQKLDATMSVANDPTGANAFNKFDVNRDGRVGAFDYNIVKTLSLTNGGTGASIGSLTDQLSAAAVVTGAAAGPLGDRTLSLVDAELNDDTLINATDFALINQNLLHADANLDGVVNSDDFGILANSFGLLTGQTYLTGDFTFDGKVNADDFGILANSFGLSIASVPSLVAGGGSAVVVPEPAGVSAVMAAAAGLLARRRRV